MAIINLKPFWEICSRIAVTATGCFRPRYTLQFDQTRNGQIYNCALRGLPARQKVERQLLQQNILL